MLSESKTDQERELLNGLIQTWITHPGVKEVFAMSDLDLIDFLLSQEGVELLSYSESCNKLSLARMVYEHRLRQVGFLE